MQRILVVTLWAFIVFTPALAQSPRNASYEIDVRLDDQAGTLEGRQVLTWRNIQSSSTSELRFHLYWNAWRNNQSTWMLEDRIRGRSSLGDDVREEDWSWIKVDTVRLLDSEPGGVDLQPGMRFIAPDDGNLDDRTVVVVPLPREVGPGETIRVEMTWRARIPRTFARTGRRGSFFFIAHWFPKLGVFEEDGWNCHQYHSATEYYSDYGTYDVRIRVPRYHVVGATGRLEGTVEHDDDTTSYRFLQDDVHAFTWTASPQYMVRESLFDEGTLPPVEIRLLLQPEHRNQAERHLAATKAALRSYGSWYGPYPYGHVTVVDPAWGSGAGGMEYPTLFTCGTRLFNPPGTDSPEGVTVHEAGHQFWYGVIGNNEFEHAWLDEGLNTFSTNRTLEVTYDPRVLSRRYLAPPGADAGRGYFPVLFPQIEVPRWARRVDRYREQAWVDAPSTPTYRYHPKSASSISYDKTSLWLMTLERYLGWETLRDILSTFYRRYQFRHPTPDNLFEVANQVSGRDLAWFFDQVHRDSVIFDYAVRSAASDPAGTAGLVERNGELVFVEADEDQGPYRSEVVVERRGGGQFPVEVLLVFEDGTEIREHWDGQARWKLFVHDQPSKLEYAVVDPDRVLMLDVNYTNNSRLIESHARQPAAKWGSKWMIWLQEMLAAFAFFA